jgi:hypothetical protein
MEVGEAMKKILAIIALLFLTAPAFAHLTTDTINSAYVCSYVAVTADLTETLAPGEPWALEEVRAHLSSAGTTEPLILTTSSGYGSGYNTQLTSQALSGQTNLIWQPDRPHIFKAWDGVTVTCNNAGGTTISLQIIWSKH